MHFATYKTILSPQNNMNIYRGCTHGCIYCDARSKCYQFSHEFEDIEVKKDAAAILEKQLAGRRKLGVVGTGSMSDPYVHAEKNLCSTRACIEVVKKYCFGMYLLTKSTLIMRDLPILQEINAVSKCVVGMTLTTYDEQLCKIVEPNVATTFERYKVLKMCRKLGIPTVVFLVPLLPYLNDTEENLYGILNYCFDAGVKGIICYGFGLTLREGNREYFYQKADIHFRGLKEQYMREFGNNYECQSRNHARLTWILQTECAKYGILSKVNEVYSYIKNFDEKYEQLSLFD